MVLPVVPAVPVEIGVETLAVVGIELKLIAELHEVYGMRPPARGRSGDGLRRRLGAPPRRSAWRPAAWCSPWAPGAAAPGAAAARPGRRQRDVTGPLLTGAAAGALLNRRETRRLGREIRDDLRRRSRRAPASSDRAGPTAVSTASWTARGAAAGPAAGNGPPGLARRPRSAALRRLPARAEVVQAERAEDSAAMCQALRSKLSPRRARAGGPARPATPARPACS